MPTPEIRLAYETLGRIVTTWTEVELLWELIFTCALHEAPRPSIDVILQQFRSGAAQRQMIMAVAKRAFATSSYEDTQVGKLFAETNDVRSMRNALVHGWYVIDPLNSRIGLRIAPGSGEQPNRYAKDQLEDILPEVLKRVETLAQHLDDFRLHLARNWLPPHKRTPDLSLPPEIQEAFQKDLQEQIAKIRAEKGW